MFGMPFADGAERLLTPRLSTSFSQGCSLLYFAGVGNSLFFLQRILIILELLRRFPFVQPTFCCTQNERNRRFFASQVVLVEALGTNGTYRPCFAFLCPVTSLHPLIFDIFFYHPSIGAPP